jgi:hypothetical protein
LSGSHFYYKEKEQMTELSEMLLQRARHYAILSKRTARAAKRKTGAEKEALKERAELLLKISRELFKKAMKQ